MYKGAVVALIIGASLYYFLGTGGRKSVPSPVVSTKYGDVQGIESFTREGKVFYEYLGIPYAKNPTGNLRFQPPLKPEKWNHVLDASSYGSECAQYNPLSRGVTGSEDCLFLNIFTPSVNQEGVRKDVKLKKVLVWIHGGAFSFGSANMYRPEYLLDEDVVVVTLNYRVGSLGFLNSGDKLAKGNMGLKDQRLALEFVKENIEFFNGDPNDVLLFGESAGGASVHYHVLSSASKGLFTKAISLSGLATAQWALRKNTLRQAKRFATNVNCPSGSTKEMMECLTALSIDEIMQGHVESTEIPQHPDSFFGPSLESIINADTFLTRTPKEIVKNKLANPVPFITGYNSHEGLLITPAVEKNTSGLMELVDKNFEEIMPKFLSMQSDNSEKLTSIMKKVRNFYIGPGQKINSSDKVEHLTDMITDFSWALPMELAAKHSEIAPTYMYYYSFQGEFTLKNLMDALHGDFHPAIEFIRTKLNKMYEKYILGKEIRHRGACHADDLALLWLLTGLSDIKKDDKDYGISKKLIKLVVSFAKNEKLKFDDVVWDPVNTSSNQIKYLKIDSAPEMVDPPFSERLQFWKQFDI